MNSRKSYLIGGLAAALLLAAVTVPTHAEERRFTFADAVPNDVFLFAAEQHNPEREFLDCYWDEVFDALVQCGVGEDLLKLIGSFLDADQIAEVERLKQRASELLAGVDWEQLVGREMAFAERLRPPVQTPGGGINMGPPDMVWLFRGSGEGADQNFAGLVAILDSVVEEINRAIGEEMLVVEKTQALGVQVAAVNLFAQLPGAPPMLVSVVQREEVVLIAMGEQMLADVLGLLNGSSSKQALADDPRFKAAFAQLPPAEDSMMFFNMQALLKPLGDLAELGIAAAGSPHDYYNNTGKSAEANELSGQALAAYQQGDFKQALALVKQAHEAAPNDSLVLYNLACFSALVGETDEALTWLDKAVDAGFHAPDKIAVDSDLESLRGDPRYEAALAKAAKLATPHFAADVILNSVKSGEAHELNMQAWEAYEEQDYEKALELVEQAYELAPQDSRVLYYLACFHALLGHEDKALDFLEDAVAGGFYSPRQIAKDPDLKNIRGDERYEAALAAAKKNAAQAGEKKAAGKVEVIKQLTDRLMNAVGILDYVAVVESTDGFSVQTESVAVLVPDARERPIYPVFCKADQLTDFDRFLPAETMSFSVSGGIDLGELYTFLEDSFLVAGPFGEELLAQWEEIQTEIGLDVRKDILDWIDGGYVSVTLEGDEGSVWLIKVTDEQVAREKITAALEFLSKNLTEAVAKDPSLAMLAMLSIRTSPVQHERLEGFEHLHFGMSPEPMVWGVAEGHLIFGTSDDVVALCLATADGAHAGIRENQRAMSEAIVPAGPFTSVTLTDQRKLGEELAMGIGMVSMVSGMMTMAIPDPEIRPVISKIAGMLAKLTPVVRKIDFYKSTANHTTFDGQAWHTHMVTHYVSPAERAAEELQ
ncbi:MAG: tetratricopeptide repeat protein [Phycisphaerae bacterium]|nr:tetratricopeptide repeat protein [Phycisphaerae bacterium]